MIQSDDPRIVEMAAHAAPREPGPVEDCRRAGKARRPVDQEEELLAGLCDGCRSGPLAGRGLHRTCRAAGGAVPGAKDSGPRGVWPRLLPAARRASPITCGTKSGSPTAGCRSTARSAWAASAPTTSSSAIRTSPAAEPGRHAAGREGVWAAGAGSRVGRMSRRGEGRVGDHVELLPRAYLLL